MEELRQAAAEDRLVMLPVERVFSGEELYSLSQLVEQTGLSPEFIERDWRALGLSRPDPKELTFTEAEITTGRMLRQLMDAGVPESDILELARIVGRASAATAEGILEIMARNFLRAGQTESELGARFGELATQLTPMMAPLLEDPVRLHMRELIRREVIGRAERAAGKLPGAREMTICFADLVGFTEFSERSSVNRVTEAAHELEILATDAAEAPVRLVKTIGDAAMLVSPETDPMLEASLNLVDAVARSEALPSLRAGVARGPALGRAGDWYGSSVNLASRLTGAAPADGVVGNEEVAGSAGSAFRASPLDSVELKGISGSVTPFLIDRA